REQMIVVRQAGGLQVIGEEVVQSRHRQGRIDDAVFIVRPRPARRRQRMDAQRREVEDHRHAADPEKPARQTLDWLRGKVGHGLSLLKIGPVSGTRTGMGAVVQLLAASSRYRRGREYSCYFTNSTQISSLPQGATSTRMAKPALGV